ncbi:4-amino-4-deoxy-L-arabinose transferase-like glycosyltransferase [Hymenobacter luteus]|uniref:4-amino-4-deoxy-L-arabinose transferase-like glycosyltransferase n=2 Tax=Hymenobacter TaxID=89966 RepID=A0A7W9WB03_9BACT|nr:glycosyltransferase family 39 protein [Hymenobacter latericoloratus]MBB4602267.1 4-amino-4-deoxy-L-arabinose transferase-like glycosyltransferase [Hymenobacter latericoloratus]MBB6059304.1 4-amino-4-deoxy-L-arabinose transferase-like glycosyltransferase [Hymenobacter luteus]
MTSRLPDWTLLLVVALTVAYFLLTHEGLYALDDYFYSRYAHQLLSGTFRVEPDPLGLLHDPLKERPLIFGPVAVCYALFGINIISTTLWPLLATLGCAGLIWWLYRRREPVVAAGAMLLLGLHYFTLNLTNYLYPDNILMFWCLAGAATLLRGREPNRRAGWWGVAFAGLSFAALLSKETIVYYLPFYLGVLAVDGWQRRHGRFWGAALATGAGLLAAYLAFYHHYTHDAFYRIHLIENTNRFLQEGNYLAGNRSALLDRITWQPLTFFVRTGLGLMLVLAAVAFTRSFGPVTTAAPRGATADQPFWLGLALVTLMLYWVGSTSLSHYNPITLLPRMTTPLLPPLALAAGFGLRQMVRQAGGRALAVGLVLLLMAAWLRSAVAVVYALPGLYFVIMGLLAARPVWPAAFRPATPGLAAATVLVLAGALAIRPLYFMRKPSVSGHFAQDRLIRRYLQRPAQGVVFVDDYLIGNYDFYYGFRLPQGLQYRRYWARDSVQLRPGQRGWLLLNRATLSNDELTRKLIRYSPDSVLSWYPRRRLVAQDGPVSLFEIGSR